MTLRSGRFALVKRFLAAENGGAQAQLLLLIACSLFVSWGAAFIVKAMLSGSIKAATVGLIGLRTRLH